MILSGCTAKQNISNVKLIEEGNTMTNNTTPTSRPAAPSASIPEMEIDTKKSYSAIFKTEMGEITVELNAKETPVTVNNFVHLARNNFYDNTVFHRTISGFMIQGGDPKGDGTGGPGYKFADEPFEGEYTRGTIAMANAGPNTNGSQFFIMHQDNPLPKDYVIFGKVIKGLETVDKIAEAPVKQNPYTGEMSVPVNPVKVNTVEIIEK
jgi:cyclophilin family peptidyl-prolyl cis-trans isomerase